MVFSYHARVERANRLAQLEEVLGFSKVILEVERNGARQCLTSSGIILIKKLDEDFVITAYMASVELCAAMYYSVGKAQIPPKVYKRVSKNIQRHPELISIPN